MHILWILSAMIQVISFLLVRKLQSRDAIIKPVGVKMCGCICNNRIGCSGYLYTAFDLSCRLFMDQRCSSQAYHQISSEGMYFFKVSKDKQRRQAEKTLTCPNKARIYHTRRNILRCRSIQIKQSQLREYTRLLMLPLLAPLMQGRQFFLCNKSVARYPFIRIRRARNLAYLPAARKVVTSSVPAELCLLSVDTGQKTIVSDKTLALGISVDNVNQLVFLSSGNRKLKVMTTEGKKPENNSKCAIFA